MEKINVAEILKNCPKGMALDCTMFEDNCVEFSDIVDSKFLPIRCRIKKSDGGYNFYDFTKYGGWIDDDKAKGVIFPKGRTTWEGFTPPCKFKDGDIVFYSNTIAIFNEWGDETLFRTYCVLYTTVSNPMYQFEISIPLFGKSIRREIRFATKEEKAKLFDAIKANGYKWNEKTKTLEKLVEPKFKVGDIITKRDSIENSWVVSSVSSEYYGLQLPKGSEGIGTLPIIDQDKYELIPNKFDITTLKPFESKVLVRDTNTDKWRGAFYSHYKSKKFYIIGGSYYYQCIPYEGNEYLLDTTNDCDNYYKNW